MAKETFRYDETKGLLRLLDETANRSHMSRNQAFEDTLQMIVCTLGRPHMEDEYMEVVERHTEGMKGKRGCDSIAQFFGQLVHGMTETNRDLIGDLFESAITRGEKGQFLTPEPICELTSRMSLPEEPTGLDGRKSVGDPCCGSGRMLMAAAEIQPNWHFVGQDVDLRCVRMTAINLALRNRYGHVVWGDSLAVEQRLIYETGRLEVWGNAIRYVDHVPLRNADDAATSLMSPATGQTGDLRRSEANEAVKSESQLHLF